MLCRTGSKSECARFLKERIRIYTLLWHSLCVEKEAEAICVHLCLSV